jgi:hypothetical protein
MSINRLFTHQRRASIYFFLYTQVIHINYCKTHNFSSIQKCCAIDSRHLLFGHDPIEYNPPYLFTRTFWRPPWGRGKIYPRPHFSSHMISFYPTLVPHTDQPSFVRDACLTATCLHQTSQLQPHPNITATSPTKICNTSDTCCVRFYLSNKKILWPIASSICFDNLLT